ncbi:hypothetical protein LshimejAT787_1701600 [Lyophyllum shimeji]|uniref:Uncharacterized protein n=1 Tax=Lyophyllum shimeji TaxID=47721 RepID=A0A9P3PYT9_LYOSH|nr:hypothetical protein LshimejAT787_1701600 [Lyophyllum shimeji]
MGTPQIIRDNVPYHSQLLTRIAELDYVPSTLSHQISYVKDLVARVQQSETQLKKLSHITAKERKEHESLRDSVARRLAHKLTGRKEKFEAKASKEEREYVEALQYEITERDSLNVLRQMLNEAKQAEVELSERAVQYESLKTELLDLYRQIFDGPTEEFPEDDLLESELQSSQALHDEVQHTLNAECQAVQLLTRADRTLSACEAEVNEALGYSQMDMWGPGGRFADMLERSALGAAQTLASQTEMLCRQAQGASPFVKPIGRVAIAQGSLISDVFFDNIFTDMAFHQKIVASAADLGRVHSRLKAELFAAQGRADNAGRQLIAVSQTLEQARLALHSFRRQAFERISQEGGTSASDEPPSYAQGVGGQRAPPSVPSPSLPGPGGDTLSCIVPPNWGCRNPYAAALTVRTAPNHNADDERGR